MPYESNDTMVYMQTVARLIEKFIPSKYDLSISINRINRVFDGLVVIEGASKYKDKSITLHSKDLNIKSILVDGKLARYSLGKDDSLKITHGDIVSNEHILTIDYSGKITDSMHGIYPCYYEHDNQKKELIATQFESHHAREVFPCVDEPEAKATFDLTITSEQNVEVLGNMPIKRQIVEGGKLITAFMTTPVMSTYLLAWVIGELHKKTARTKGGVEVNVWATPAQPSKNLDFALDIATRSIEFYDEYFGVPYPLSKCDHIALPDFSSGAMENWGLITYREIALLADYDKTSIANKHYVATVISHELSHQWFGNLVTMKWWNDLWLNESFASLVEYTAIDAIEPSWDVWLDFASFESIAALRRDSLAGVQSVQIDVNHPDEISTLFDGAIVYAKGARLLKMLEYYIGEKAFRAGLTKYFNAFSYKNTEAKDLWDILSQTSGKEISSFMSVWISQPGFPVLHVSKKGDDITLSQERLSNSSKKTSDKSLWPIPLNSNYGAMPEIMDKQLIKVSISGNKPLRFNVGNNAHYITHYDHNLLEQIIAQINSGEISPLDRLQILNEQIILANSGIISNADLIPLLDAYKNETAEAVWDIIGMTIGELKKFVEDDDEAEKKLRALADSLAKSQFNKLGWKSKPNEPESDTKLRNVILSLMIYSENQKVIDYSIDLFNSTPIEKIDSEIRDLIISTAVRYGSDIKMTKSLLKKYKSTSSVELKQDISVGLTSTKNPNVVKLLLNTLKDTDTIRTQDTARWIVYLIRNKIARSQTWDWIRNNWDWIDSTFSGDKSYDDFPRYAAMALSKQNQLNEYIKFFTPHRKNPTLTRVIDMGINEITNRVKIINRDGLLVQNILKNF